MRPVHVRGGRDGRGELVSPDEACDLIEEIDQDRLSTWEIDFIDSLTDRIEAGQYLSAGQAGILREIHERRS